MREFVAGAECGFVTPAGAAGPEPAYWEACPGCGAAEFQWIGSTDGVY